MEDSDELNIRTKKVEDFDSDEFTQSIEIYKSSFPSNETRPPEKVIEMLRNDKNYHLFISFNDESVIGISLMYTFSSLNIGLLDYIAVKRNYQGKGIGKKLFKFTLDKLEELVSNESALLIEVQRENVTNSQEDISRKNRIKFYMRLGGRILDGVNYLLPPLQPGSEPEDMYLVMRPLKQIDYLSKESVVQYIDAIYSTVYQYQGHDLLEKISQKLPAKIMLRSMVI